MREWEEQMKRNAGFWSQSGAGLRESGQASANQGAAFSEQAGRTEVRRQTQAEHRAAGHAGEDKQAGPASARRQGLRALKTLENAYGSIEFGVGEGQIALRVSRKTAYREPGLRGDQKELNENRTAFDTMESGRFYVDSHHKEDSALLWKEASSVPAERVLEELRRLAQQGRQRTLLEMIPALQEREEGAGSISAFDRNLLRKIRRNLQETRQEAQRSEQEAARVRPVHPATVKSAAQAEAETEAETETDGEAPEDAGQENKQTKITF